MKNSRFYTVVISLCLAFPQLSLGNAKRGEIQHDAEHYMLLAQHGERWASEDKVVAEKLSEVRKANDGKRPNFLFVLIDDVGFGEMGDPVLNAYAGIPHRISMLSLAKA